MDGLALLCNLHADGPVSLRRLRRSGIRTLPELVRTPESSLASVLHASPTHAHRLQYEAEALDRRLLEQPLEPELVATGDDGSTLFDPIEPDCVEPIHSMSLDEALEVVQACGSAGGDEEDDELGAFLAIDADSDVWSGPDEPEEPEEPDLTEPEELAYPAAEEIAVAARSVALQAFDLEPPGLEPEGPPCPTRPVTREEEALLAFPQPTFAELLAIPAPESEPSPEPVEPPGVDAGSPLRAGELPGLSRRTVERLVREGVRTYRSLVDLTSLSLARRTGLAYTRLLELSFAARALLRGSDFEPVPPDGISVLEGAPTRTEEPATQHGDRIVELVPVAAPRRDEAPRERPPTPVAVPVARSAEPIREDPGVAGPFS